jgi:hypothetical protein
MVPCCLPAAGRQALAGKINFWGIVFHVDDLLVAVHFAEESMYFKRLYMFKNDLCQSKLLNCSRVGAFGFIPQLFQRISQANYSKIT